MSYFIIIRHTSSQPDPQRPAHLWELTPKGIAQTRALADALRPYNVHKIYTSEEAKACTTGEYVADYLGIDYEISPNLHETRAMTAPFFDDMNEFRARVAEAMRHPEEVLYGEEAFVRAYQRFERQLRVLSLTHPTQTIAIITHGRVMAMYVGETCGIKPYDVWQQLDLPAFAVIRRSDMKLIKLVASLKSLM